MQRNGLLRKRSLWRFRQEEGQRWNCNVGDGAALPISFADSQDLPESMGGFLAQQKQKLQHVL